MVKPFQRILRPCAICSRKMICKYFSSAIRIALNSGEFNSFWIKQSHHHHYHHHLSVPDYPFSSQSYSNVAANESTKIQDVQLQTTLRIWKIVFLIHCWVNSKQNQTKSEWNIKASIHSVCNYIIYHRIPSATQPRAQKITAKIWKMRIYGQKWNAQLGWYSYGNCYFLRLGLVAGAGTEPNSRSSSINRRGSVHGIKTEWKQIKKTILYQFLNYYKNNNHNNNNNNDCNLTRKSTAKSGNFSFQWRERKTKEKWWKKNVYSNNK